MTVFEEAMAERFDVGEIWRVLRMSSIEANLVGFVQFNSRPTEYRD